MSGTLKYEKLFVLTFLHLLADMVFVLVVLLLVKKEFVLVRMMLKGGVFMLAQKKWSTSALTMVMPVVPFMKSRLTKRSAAPAVHPRLQTSRCQSSSRLTKRS